MCGIAGILSLSDAVEPSAVARMCEEIASRLAHRGPDDNGVWLDERRPVALAHRRLAVIDLSPTGRQPMASRSGRWVTSYNGEIYNYQKLRGALLAAGHAFKGTSDTEVLVEAVDEWGVDQALRRINGMYAVALWDRQTATLTLARDPIGEKPLYYGWADDDFVFASELGAIRAHPRCPSTIDQRALAHLLRHKFIPAPLTIIDGVHKLGAGEIISLEASLARVAPHRRKHWDAIELAHSAFSSQETTTDDAAIEELEDLLTEAVHLRAIADVPVGAFLSGGIDSSTIVALLASRHPAVKTYSIGFRDPAFDEAPHAAAVARHLGTDHTELYFGPSELLEVVPRMASVYSEPFADSSQLPTTVVAALARERVKVILSGDGGDELFGGYGRYSRVETWWPKIGRIPRPLRMVASRAFEFAGTSLPASRLPALRILPPQLRARPLGVTLAGRARGLRARTLPAFYRDVLSDWVDPTTALRERGPDEFDWPSIEYAPTERELMMLTDLLVYLPEDILVKVDRASMAVGLETRVPFLDTRVVELSWRLPIEMKVRDGREKWILRQIAARHVPEGLLDRPKQGFGVPLAGWLRGPLRRWADEQLSLERITDEGHFKPTTVRRIWRAHLDGRGDWTRWLWSILMFQAWHDRWRS